MRFDDILNMRKITYLLLFMILSACNRETPHYNGYIDADLTYLSSDYAGRLADIAVLRGENVQKNQYLFKLEQTSENNAVTMSEFSYESLLAQQKQIAAQLQYAEINSRRTAAMRRDKSASQNDVDVTQKDKNVYSDQLIGIQAQMNSSLIDIKNKKWQASRKEGYATNPGIVYETYFTQGEFVQAGQPVVALITQQKIKVIFFVGESELSRIRLNQKVLISSDGTQQKLNGTISYIAQNAQYTSPIIFSREERTILVFRVEARIENPNLNQIHLGQPIILELLS